MDFAIYTSPFDSARLASGNRSTNFLDIRWQAFNDADAIITYRILASACRQLRTPARRFTPMHSRQKLIFLLDCHAALLKRHTKYRLQNWPPCMHDIIR